MRPYLEELSQKSPFFVSCYPNAGLPDEEGKYLETPTSLAAQLEKFVNHGWLNLVGGCCGTTEKHIRAIAQMVDGKRPRVRPTEAHRAVYSGIETIEADDSTRPLLVGERTNVIGSRLFKNLVAEEKWEEATEIARRQVKGGAHIVDVCLQSTERDERKDIEPFYEKLIRKIKAPVMIDTTDPTAVELALTERGSDAVREGIQLVTAMRDRLTRPLCRPPSMRAIGASSRGAGPGGAVRSRLARRSRKLSIHPLAGSSRNT